MNKKLIKLIGVLLSIVCLYFIFKRLKSLDENVLEIILSPDSSLLILSISILYIIGLVFAAFGWSSQLKNEFQEFKNSGKVTLIYIYTMVGKYLPSGVMHFAARQVTLTKYADLSQKQALKTIALDLNGYITSSLIITCIGLCTNLIILPKNFPLQEYSVLFGFLGFIGIIVKEKIIQKIRLANSRFSKQYFHALIFYIIYFIFASLCFYIILKYFDQGSDFNFLNIFFTYPICWLLGFIIFGAPAGIGVREAIMIYVFSTTFPESVIITSALILRVTNIFGEVIGFIVTKFQLFRGTNESRSV